MRQVTLEQKIRATGVSRWHIVRTAVRQSLADHLYSVAMIAESMLAMWAAWYHIDGMKFYERYRSKIIDKALHHDVLEALTGDFPSTYKRWYKGMTGHRMPDPTHLMSFDNRMSHAGNVADNVILDAIVELADRVEAFHFIDRYALDDHGRLVADRLEVVLEEADTWMPRCVIDVLVTHSPRWTNTIAPFTCHKRAIGREELNEYRVDWPGFARASLSCLQATPEEISDDEMARGPFPDQHGDDDSVLGGPVGPNREPPVSGQCRSAVLPERKDGGDRAESDGVLQPRSQNPAKAPADVGSA